MTVYNVGDRVRYTTPREDLTDDAAVPVGSIGTVRGTCAPEAPERLFVEFDEVPNHPLFALLGAPGWGFFADEVESVAEEEAAS